MKAKRRVCALLFSALMIWQGFMIVNAEDTPVAAANGDQVAETGDAKDTPESGAIVDTITQEGNRNGRESTAPGAPAGGGPTQQDDRTVTQAGSGSQTATDSVVAESPAAGEIAGGAGARCVDNVIQNAKIFLDGNKPEEPGDQWINRTTVLQLKADLKVAGKKLHEGDCVEIQLPDVLKSDTTNFVIKAWDKVVANGNYDGTSNIIQITFTKDIETINKADGDFFFKVRMNKEQAKEKRPYNLVIQVNGKPLKIGTVNYDPEFKEKPKTFFKDTVRPNSEVIQQITVGDRTHYLVRYRVTFDAAHYENPSKDYKKVVFTDTLGSPALSYFDPAHHHPDLSVANAEQYKPVMQRGVWRTFNYNEGGGMDVAPDDTDAHRGDYWSLRDKDNNSKDAQWTEITPTYYEENGVKKFKVNLGDIGKNEGVVLMYYAEIVGEIPVKGKIYANSARLEGDGIDPDPKKSTREKTFTRNEAGGSVGQKPFKIKVYKTGENEAPLQGAVFKLSRMTNGKPDGAYQILTTDAKGEAVIDNAIRDNYELVEMQAPDGYQKEEKKYKITTDDFNTAANNIKDNGVIGINVINQKAPNPPPTPNNPPTPGNPPTPNNPPTPGNPPATPPTPGQVLGARRYPEGQGGQEQEKPAVLGTRRGRGSADTSDHSASDIHWLLFGFGTAGLFAICINELVGLEKLLYRIKSRR